MRSHPWHCLTVDPGDLDEASMKCILTRVTKFDEAQCNNNAHMYRGCIMKVDIWL